MTRRHRAAPHRVLGSNTRPPAEIATDVSFSMLAPLAVGLVVVVGGYLNQDAFQQAKFLAPVQAIVTSADPVSIALGVIWLVSSGKNSSGSVPRHAARGRVRTSLS